MGEFRMPSLGADMDVGTIIEWLVKPGDSVQRGQTVAVVDTAKAAIEIEAFESGVVEEILIGPGVQVPVGTPLAVIGAGAAPEPSVQATGAPDVAIASLGPSSGPPEAPQLPVPPRATPPVRHLAHQLGVDLEAITGSGPDGHVTRDDVLNAATLIGAPPVAVPPAEPAAAAPSARPAESHAPPARPSAGVAGARLRATPRARRIAAERGIDLEAVAGSGSGGAVLAADVQRATRRPPPATTPPKSAEAGSQTSASAVALPTQPVADRAKPERRAAMRTAIANLMSRSNAEIPHYYVTQTMDVEPAMAWLRGRNATLPPDRRLLPAVVFLRATVLAAIAVPDLNGHWVAGELHPADRVDLGVAIATRGGGLVTPAIPDAGPLRIDDLMARLADLVRRARRGNLTQGEMAGASITVSSLGENGPDALYGVIFPPQVALVGVGGIVERPWAVDGMLTVRHTVTIVVAADHRASDGRTVSAFLAAFARAVAHPEEM